MAAPDLTDREQMATMMIVGAVETHFSRSRTGREASYVRLVVGSLAEGRRALVLAAAASRFLGAGRRDTGCRLWLEDQGADLALASDIAPPPDPAPDVLRRIGQQRPAYPSRVVVTRR